MLEVEETENRIGGDRVLIYPSAAVGGSYSLTIKIKVPKPLCLTREGKGRASHDSPAINEPLQTNSGRLPVGARWAF